jgi:hypothetical protein
VARREIFLKMALLDIWDYVRSMGDRRLRKQGYVASGMGIIERYRKVPGFWSPHLERNRKNMLDIAGRLESRGGTLLILGAGRLLDVPWEALFPRFDRVVLYDADVCIVSYVERIMAASRVTGVPKPSFEIGDLTGTVVDVAAWAEHAISQAASPAAAAQALGRGFDSVTVCPSPWARAYADVRLVVSTNLMSQLGYFPRLHVQNEFRKRFKFPFGEHAQAAESLEKYFDRVRARHILDMAMLKKSWAYISTDVESIVYALSPPAANILSARAPVDGGVRLNDAQRPEFDWPAQSVDSSDPLHGQRVKDLWPADTRCDAPQRWVWHIVPQGSEKAYQDKGRIHIVESWVKHGG